MMHLTYLWVCLLAHWLDSGALICSIVLFCRLCIGSKTQRSLWTSTHASLGLGMLPAFCTGPGPYCIFIPVGTVFVNYHLTLACHTKKEGCFQLILSKFNAYCMRLYRLIEKLDFPDSKFTLYFLGYHDSKDIPEDRKERVRRRHHSRGYNTCTHYN